MKKIIKQFFENEILSYLFFGVATTVVAVLTRILVFKICQEAMIATALGNIMGILFAFVTNDRIVFKQKRKGILTRFYKFILARLGTFVLDLSLTWIFVNQFPQIIGQFVGGNLDSVNTIETLIAQFLIIVLNYVFSKIFVFTNKAR